jgi:HK97 family phage major capsid protein
MLTKKEQLEEALGKVQAMCSTAEGREFSASEKKEVNGLLAKARDLKAKIEAEDAIKSFGDQVGFPIGQKGITPFSSKQSPGSAALTLSTKDVKDIQEAAISGTFLRKAVTTTQAPFSTIPQFDQDVVALARDKTRLLSFIPAEQTDAPTVNYYRATTGATAAAAVAEGANKPESNPVWEQVSQPVRKLAHYTRANDEVLQGLALLPCWMLPG